MGGLIMEEEMNEQIKEIAEPKCWWKFYHRWSNWTTILQDKAGNFVQEKKCEKCGLAKRKTHWSV